MNTLLRTRVKTRAKNCRHYSVVNTPSREPHSALSIRASRNLPARPHWTRDGCSRLSRPEHPSFRSPPHHRIRLWRDSCNSHLTTRSDFWRTHQPSHNARPHHRRKRLVWKCLSHTFPSKCWELYSVGSRWNLSLVNSGRPQTSAPRNWLVA